MIPKYRNRGIAQLVLAISLTALLIYLICQGGGLHTSDNWVVLGTLLYIACWATWLLASFSLAKAKGYGRDYTGSVLIFLFLLSFCFPVALFVFPVVVIFGLSFATILTLVVVPSLYVMFTRLALKLGFKKDFSAQPVQH